MVINDLINGSFELLSGGFCLINIFQLVKDKKLSGVSWVPTMFFTIWGCWNLYYYPSLGQTMSFIGGIVIFVINSIWLFLVFYYKQKYK